VALNGTACDDGNACTQTDTCQAGVCTGGNPVTCTALDQCHTAGTCNPTTGICSNPLIPPFKIAGGSMFNAPSIELAYDSLQSAETLEIQAESFTEITVLLQNISVIMIGGYSCDFSSNVGFTTLHGSLTIGDGTVTIGNFVIEQ
jgi:hypothetical protein